MTRRPRQIASTLIAAAVLLGCNSGKPFSGFTLAGVDRSITGSSAYPLSIDPKLVGTYPPDTDSGAGYFYDQVLEYRVWFHPERGAEPLNGHKDYFVAFAQYETAEAYSKRKPGGEEPLALVRQLQWIGEPERGHFVPEIRKRITEWQVKWLRNSKRTDRSISEFMKNPQEADP